MIFMFDLDLGPVDGDVAAAVAAECEATGAWPIDFVPGRAEKRWFGVEKAYPPVIEIVTEDDAGSILAAGATRDADAIAFRPEALASLARTVAVIGEHFPAGFVFRATWSGSPILYDEHLTVVDLVRRIRASGLNEFTRYRVEPPSPR